MLTPGQEPFTYRDLLLIPEDGIRREIIDGDLFVSPSPATLHQLVSRRLVSALMRALEDTGLAEVWNAPTDLVFDDTNVVVPDLVIVGAAKAHLVTKRAIEGSADVVVEILSPGSGERDRHIKRHLYERFRIPEYWIVAPESRTITAYTLGTERYDVRAQYDASCTLVCPLFPTLAVALAPVFAPRAV